MKEDQTFIKYYEIGPYPVYFGFAQNPKNFQKELNRLGIKESIDFIKENKAGITHFLENKKHLVIIICIDFSDKHSLSEICGLVTHECVHAWQGLLDYIGEKQKPGDEIEAYHIQSMVQYILSTILKNKNNYSSLV
jgi:hypothetical protein